MDKDDVKVKIKSYSDFYTIEIIAGESLEIKFFLYSEQQLVNFKNSFIQAQEKKS